MPGRKPRRRITKGEQQRAVAQALSGTGAHVETATVFDSFDWKLSGMRPDGSPYSVFELLNHMLYWQGWVARWLQGEDPPTPEHASGSWPGATGPATREEWKRVVRQFKRGHADLMKRSGGKDVSVARGGKTRLEMLHTIASHNSYHAGQVVIVRRMLGAWPPSSGGLTW